MLQVWKGFTTLVLLAAGLMLAPAETAAQTPATTVKDSEGTVVFQSNVDGGLLAPGEIGTGTIPVEGGGTRLMWYPAKAAFRAGQVGTETGTEDNWNEDNVGNLSLAFGEDPLASGFAAIAIGEGTVASGPNATAFGAVTTADGLEATALGRGTHASGQTATAMGFRTVAATPRSLTSGRCNDANQTNDGTLFAIGNGTASVASCTSRSDALVLQEDGRLMASGPIESGEGGFVLPDGTILDENKDVVPVNENGAFDFTNDNGMVAPGTFDGGTIPTEGAGTRMMWYPEKAAFRAGQVGKILDGTQWNAAKIGDYSSAFGVDTEANGLATMAAGERTYASGNAATAMGIETVAEGRATLTAGTQAFASGRDAAAMGLQTTAATDQSLSIGRYNSANTSADNSLFVVGNGDGPSPDGRSDAFVVQEDGSAIASSHDTFSDRRLKTGIDPLGAGTLDKLLRLRPVRYQFKDQNTHPSGGQLGLIAQDVRKEFPKLVSEGSDGTLSLAYPKLTAVLVKGLQEQQATIDSLRGRVQSLEMIKERQDRLAEQVATLQGTKNTPGALPAGWGLSSLLAVLLALGGFGGGLLWRHVAA